MNESFGNYGPWVSFTFHLHSITQRARTFKCINVKKNGNRIRIQDYWLLLGDACINDDVDKTLLVKFMFLLLEQRLQA